MALKKLAPAKAKSWGSFELAQAKRYQIPPIVRAQHAEWGADMVEAAGGDEQTVNLIRRHQDPEGYELKSEEDILLRILQAADNVS